MHARASIRTRTQAYTPALPTPLRLQAYFPAAAFDCIDTSANVWGGGGGGGPGSPRGAAGFATLARMHQSTDRLDAIAP